MLKETIVLRATNIVLEEIPKYITNTDKYAISKFNNGKLTLEELGICNGVAKLIDIKIQEIHPDICILSTDTLIKFQEDIYNHLDKKFIVPKFTKTKKK